MNDNYIHVQITKGGANKNARDMQERSFSPKREEDISKSGAVGSIRQGAINTALIYAGKTALNYGLSNYESLTGDHLMQQQINDGLQAFGMVAMGLSNPIGTIALGAQIGIASANRLIALERSNIISRQTQARVGITLGGSRW